MEQSIDQNNNTQPYYHKVIGNTTYVVHVHFSETSKETLGDKIKRLIREESRENMGSFLYVDVGMHL